LKSCQDKSLPSKILRFLSFQTDYQIAKGINLCNFVNPPLEGARFTWSSHEELPILSHIDHFLFSVEWEDHYQGAHQVTLPKISSYHVPILLHVGDVPLVKRPFRFENVWLEVEEFPHHVKTRWDQFHISSSLSYVLAKKNLIFSSLNLKSGIGIFWALGHHDGCFA